MHFLLFIFYTVGKQCLITVVLYLKEVGSSKSMVSSFLLNIESVHVEQHINRRLNPISATHFYVAIHARTADIIW